MWRINGCWWCWVGVGRYHDFERKSWGNLRREGRSNISIGVCWEVRRNVPWLSLVSCISWDSLHLGWNLQGRDLTYDRDALIQYKAVVWHSTTPQSPPSPPSPLFSKALVYNYSVATLLIFLTYLHHYSVIWFVFKITDIMSSSQNDSRIKGLIRCESCPKSFAKPGKYKYCSLPFSARMQDS